MRCGSPVCHNTVGQPYIRLATGERGGPATYDDTYVCSWHCLVVLARALDQADHCNEEIGYHSSPHKDCILR